MAKVIRFRFKADYDGKSFVVTFKGETDAGYAIYRFKEFLEMTGFSKEVIQSEMELANAGYNREAAELEAAELEAAERD